MNKTLLASVKAINKKTKIKKIFPKDKLFKYNHNGKGINLNKTEKLNFEGNKKTKEFNLSNLKFSKNLKTTINKTKNGAVE